MAVFRDYSLSNQLAIARQRPTELRVAGNRAINQSVYFDQNFSPPMQKVTNGVSDAIRSILLSSTGR